MVTQSVADRAWARHTPKERWMRLGIFALVALAVGWSLSSINIIWSWVWDAPAQIGDLAGRMVPPDFSDIRAILWALVETLNIATIATFIAVLVSLPVAYISAQNTTPNRATLWLGRFILVSSRSVNTLIWALLFVAIFGPGVMAGIVAIMFRSLGFLGKLLGEAIEEIDRRPVEALEATGASRAKVILYAIVPQVVPTFFAVGILRWDINLRESTVLGLVGAGGIGVILQGAIDTLHWRTVATILLAIIGLVIAGEAVAAWLRKKVI
ncbi:phosphonate ABC transporter, permease protein PhnE [Allopusillimonas soli]|uniref:Phosphonate ABC transporter, permease protein PhnE n=1 Tax=Allopusillimonas soli TaxID=659016 RepID=A0A853FDL2_9BURK|nr:phosphonate ABC transporter, permease protein PhnE [Allopusillimonas soli]NYT38163.1 phosphonate ABC transporter, permease protein PhnE [Allopusillimonas soli]TEA74035.1 phosphonate ABC transporter, permease protein PhnE [Allopusillimonas soli]